jgi:signal peptidase I
MKKRLLLSLLALALVAGLADAWWSFAPRELGGRNAYVVTSGTSMQPRFHSGDVGILRVRESYAVGDVVGYRSKALHSIVMHRIVAEQDGRFAFKGDNNSWIDPERLGSDAIVGKLWLHVPRGGVVLQWVRREQLPLGLGMAVIMLLGTAGGATRRVRRRRPRKAAAPPTAGPGAGRDVARVAAGAALAVALGVGTWAFLRPAEEAGTRPASYEQTGVFGYTAGPAPGAAYGGRRLRTGDTVFLRLVRNVDVWFEYGFRTAAPHRTHGSISLAAELRDGSGWTRTLPLGRMAFRGDSGTIRHRLRPAALNRVVAAARAQTGAASGSTDLTLVAHVLTAGTVRGAPLAGELTSRLEFGLDELSLRPLAEASGAPQRESGSVAVAAVRPTTIGFGLLSLDTRTARLGSAAAALLALLALGVLRYAARGAAPAREIDRIRARHGSLLVPIDAWPAAIAQPVVEVASWDALRRIAETVQSPILDAPGRTATLLVLAPEAAYAYRPTPAPDASEPAGLRRVS